MKKSKLPSTLKIIGKEYKVTYTKKGMPFKVSGKKHFRYAMATNDNRTGKIHIQTGGYCNDEILTSLLHESFHVISARLSLDLTENQIDKMSIGVKAILMDNPKLYRLLK